MPTPSFNNVIPRQCTATIHPPPQPFPPSIASIASCCTTTASAMNEPYQKVGRGGAGNFYSKKDIQDLSDTQAQDGDAQNTADEHAAQHDAYQRVGRGGAGNFVAPSEDERASALEGMHQTKELVKEKLQGGQGWRASAATDGAKAPAYRGRGGMGNWAGDEDKAEAERARGEELQRVEVEERVRREVEGGLRAPPRAYSMEGRGDDDF